MGKKKTEDADNSNVSSDTDHDNGKSDHDTRTRMAAFKFNEFDSGKEPWRYYIQRFELETLIQNLDLPETKRNLLLKCIGAANYRMVVDHFDPTPILQVSFKSIKEFLDSFFKPPTSLLQERIRFGECKQKPEQSVAQFVNDLRSAAINCAFGATLDERLRDQFLIGLQNPAMLEEIFTQHPGEKVKFADVEHTATVVEGAQLQRRALENPSSSSDVNAVKQTKNYPSQNSAPPRQNNNNAAYNKRFSRNKPRSSPKQQNNGPSTSKAVIELDPTKQCIRCGNNKHSNRNSCPAINATCRRCQKVGHWDKVCSQSPNVTIRQSSEQIKQVDFLPIYSLQSPSKKYFVKMFLNRVFVQMEYDTAAARSLIGPTLWSKIGKPKLRPTEPLGAYPNTPISLLGEADISVTLRNTTKQLTVIVTKDDGTPLLGSQWMEAFGIQPKGDFLHTSVYQVQRSNPSSADADCKQIYSEFPILFSDGLGKIKNNKLTIHLHKEAIPKLSSARSVPLALRKPVEAEIDRLAYEDVWEPVDTLQTPIEWASPLVVTLRKNSKIRLCGDFKRTINPYILPQPYRLPTFEEVTAAFAGFTEFSTIDLKDAFLQLEIDESSRKYLVVATHKGYYRFKRMPFGITVASLIYQKVMDTILAGIDGVVCYQDDIALGGKDRQDHLNRLRKVLLRLQDAGMKTQRDKLAFLCPSITYLGHTIDKDGIRPTAEKVAALQQLPTPTNVSQLRSFLGSVTHFSRFIPNLQSKCHPLHRLLQANARWQWTQSDQKIFDLLKTAITESTLLVHFDPALPLVITTDASEYGVGAVLQHRFQDNTLRPIAAASRTLTAAESNYKAIDREALAIMFAVKKFEDYILGRQFTLQTDHKPLERIFGPKSELPKLAASCLARWSIELSAYNYELEHVQGRNNLVADMLSRLPIKATQAEQPDEIHAINDEVLDAYSITPSIMRKHTLADHTLSKVIRFLETGWPAKSLIEPDFRAFFEKKEEISFERGIHLWHNRIIVPSSLRRKILQRLHESHPGVNAMKSLARISIWWPCCDKEIENLVKSCDDCQKHQPQEPSTPLNLWNLPSKPWDRIHIDFTGPYNGLNWFVIIDAYSRWLEIFPLQNATSAAAIHKLRELLSRYGICRQIVSDNGSQFTSQEFTDFCRRNGIKLTHTTPYHSRSNGLVERSIRTFKHRFNKSANEMPDYNQRLQTMLYTYRNTEHSSTNRRPSELFLGRRLLTFFDHLKPDLPGDVDGKNFNMKQRHDLHTSARSFKPGDSVWYRRKDPHLSEGWRKAEVTDQTGPLSYRIKDNSGNNVRVHADHLRSRLSTSQQPEPVPQTPEPTPPALESTEATAPEPASPEVAQPTRPICTRQPPRRFDDEYNY
ncbi:hypothetical protein V9T40_011209 [Parthenolecanium corni]|uniref:RNA-directed DNA polymerase n=1 Tax=Parthenolecanium corni TaxID=536013 RepID=A0AAN9XZ97_9HEMI